MVIETNPPGQAKLLGLDYATLAAVNPALVVVSITNWGQTGPYKDYQATDLVAVAMGGHMYLNGDAEHGPVRTLAPQAFAQVNSQAAVGALTALYARGVNDGVGQHVDVSMQEAVANAMDSAQATWDIRRQNLSGPGLRRNNLGIPSLKYLFECRDGWVAATNAGGLQGPTSTAVIDWLAETNEDGGLSSAAWRARLAVVDVLEAAEMETVEAAISAFCAKRDKEALVAEAQRRGAGWAPVYSPAELVDNEQLKARDYWIRVQHDDLGESFIYPGAPWKMSETPWRQRGRAPRIGEHNEQVYGELLGLEPADLRRLRMKMVL